MTAQAVEQYLADEGCPELVHTVAQLKEEKTAFFRIAAPGFTPGELWLPGPGLITSPSTREEGGRLEEEPILPTTLDGNPRAGPHFSGWTSVQGGELYKRPLRPGVRDASGRPRSHC